MKAHNSMFMVSATILAQLDTVVARMRGEGRTAGWAAMFPRRQKVHCGQARNSAVNASVARHHQEPNAGRSIGQRQFQQFSLMDGHRPARAARRARSRTPCPLPSNSDDEADVMVDARRQVIHRGRQLARHWASGNPGRAPAWRLSLSTQDEAALLLRRARSANAAEGDHLAAADAASSDADDVATDAGPQMPQELAEWRPALHRQADDDPAASRTSDGAAGGPVQIAEEHAMTSRSSRTQFRSSPRLSGQRSASESSTSELPIVTVRHTGRPTIGARKRWSAENTVRPTQAHAA